MLLLLVNYNYISLFSWTNIFFPSGSVAGILNLLLAYFIKIL